MKIKLLNIFLTLFSFFCLSPPKSIFANITFVQEGNTGSPADNGSTCARSRCHDTYNLNEGNAIFFISAPGTYPYGEKINITISFDDSNSEAHGFQLSALDANNEHVGIFDSTDDSTQASSTDFISHTFAGTNQMNWTVEWTPPSSAVDDPVTFYAAGCEADGNGRDTNDYVYTTNTTIAVAIATTPTPVTTPIPGLCEMESIGISPSKLKLKYEESDEVTVIVTGDDNCPVEGVMVDSEIKTGKKRVEISPESTETDENGEATFTITAKKKKGNAKIIFEAGGLKVKLKVKIRKN